VGNWACSKGLASIAPRWISAMRDASASCGRVTTKSRAIGTVHDSSMSGVAMERKAIAVLLAWGCHEGTRD
jgi:hypothetical protein